MRFRCQTSQAQQQLQALPLQTTRGRHRSCAGENRGEGKLPAHAARASPQARPVPQQPIRNLADGAALTAGTAVEDDRITLLRSIWFPKMESAAYVTGSPHKGLQRGRKGSRHFYLKIPPGAEPLPGFLRRRKRQPIPIVPLRISRSTNHRSTFRAYQQRSLPLAGHVGRGGVEVLLVAPGESRRGVPPPPLSRRGCEGFVG